MNPTTLAVYVNLCNLVDTLFPDFPRMSRLHTYLFERIGREYGLAAINELWEATK